MLSINQIVILDDTNGFISSQENLRDLKEAVKKALAVSKFKDDLKVEHNAHSMIYYYRSENDEWHPKFWKDDMDKPLEKEWIQELLADKSPICQDGTLILCDFLWYEYIVGNEYTDMLDKIYKHIKDFEKIVFAGYSKIKYNELQEKLEELATVPHQCKFVKDGYTYQYDFTNFITMTKEAIAYEWEFVQE